MEKQLNQLSYQIINAAIAVHEELGPGLLESIYSRCLSIELAERGLSFQRELYLPVFYKGYEVGEPLIMDIVVENSIILELKSVEEVKPVHVKQLLTYLRLAKKELGLLINFNCPLLKKGIHRVANNQKLA
jgi:GxxExxY protein